MFIDTMKVIMQNKLMPQFNTLAEAGIDVEDNDETGIENGYYYISIFVESEKEKFYTVSLSSVYEYFYGYVDKEETPKFLEKYETIEDAKESGFYEIFKKLEKLIELGTM